MLPVILLLVLIGLGTAPAFADTQADIAEAERQIELRQLAKEIRARAYKRAKLARRGSSVYKAYEAARDKWEPIQKAVWKEISEARERDFNAMIDDLSLPTGHRNVNKRERHDALMRLYDKGRKINKAANSEMEPLLKDWLALEKTLFSKFLEEEILSAVGKKEREILRKLIQKLEI